MTKKKKQADSYEGLQGHIKALETPSIESWAFQFPGSQTAISVTIPEFTCMCPKTGQPDFAAILISYTPAKVCVELKSLKLYLWSYRNEGIFHEEAINRILDDLVQACEPVSMMVTGEFNLRGGIRTVVTANYPYDPS